MKPKLLPVLLLVMGLAWNFSAGAADPIYKCLKNGKARYTSTPKDSYGDCQQANIPDDTPKPEDVARAIAENQRREEADRIAQALRQKEREVLAKEREAAAAERRAAATESLLRQNQNQYYQPPTIIFPYSIPLIPPYWPGRPIHLMPPNQAVPIMPEPTGPLGITPRGGPTFR